MTTAADLEIEGVTDLEPIDTEGSLVFRGRHKASDTRVAIKILNPTQDPLVPRRSPLRRRAPLARFSEDDGVVEVLASETTADGRRYLLMPFYRIGSLADQLVHGRMPWHGASKLIARTAQIVANAHVLDLVLADIRPSSIMLTDPSSPILAVYGMARRRFDDGSPRYAAPEVTPGAPLTPAADVYSLCLSLAALLAGRPPKRGETGHQLLANIDPHTPRALTEIVHRGLSIDPSDRHRNAGELANALAGYLNGELPGANGGNRTTELSGVDLEEFLGEETIDPRGPGRERALFARGGPDDPLDLEALLELPTTPTRFVGETEPGLQSFDLDDVLGPRTDAAVPTSEDQTPVESTTEPPPHPEDQASIGATDRWNPDPGGAVIDLRDEPSHPTTGSPDVEISHPAETTPASDRDVAAADRDQPTEAQSAPVADRDVAAADRDQPTEAQSAPASDRDVAAADRDQRTEAQSAPVSDRDVAAADRDELPGDATDVIDLRDDPMPPPDAAPVDSNIGSARPGGATSGQTTDVRDPGSSAARQRSASRSATEQLRPRAAAPAAYIGTNNQAVGMAAPSTEAAPAYPQDEPPTVEPAQGRRQAQPPVPPMPPMQDATVAMPTVDERSSEADNRQGRSGTPPLPPSGPIAAAPMVDRVIEPTSLFPDHAVDQPGAPAIQPYPTEPNRPTGFSEQRVRPLPTPRTADDAMPYRPFERQQLYSPNDGFLDRVRYRIQSAWFNRQISLTGIVAVLTFALFAGFAVMLIIRDFRAGPPSSATTLPATTINDGPETVAVLPTSVSPQLPEPASTHVTRASRGIAQRVTTTAGIPLPPVTAPPTTVATTAAPPTSAQTTSNRPPPTTATTLPPSTTVAVTTTRPPTTATTQPPATAPPTTKPEPIGPTKPLIREATVSRVRATSARVSFQSPACVTAAFSYAAAGGSSSQVSGGSRCATDHTLLLGTVTPDLRPGTTYTVIITASDGSDAARRTLSFTTLG